MLGDVESDRDELVCFGEVGAECVEASGCGAELGVEALLFAAEHVDADGVVVVGFEELAFSSFDRELGVLERCPFGFSVGAQVLESVAQECLEVLAEVLAEADAVVEVSDGVFDVLDLDGAEGAFGALGVPAEAGVVRVSDSVAVRGYLDDHAEAAVPAVERGLEVVVVLDRSLAVDLLPEDRLDFLEGLAVDEWGGCPGTRHP